MPQPQPLDSLSKHPFGFQHPPNLTHCASLPDRSPPNRLKKLGIPVVGVNTGKECHLDAHLVEHAIDHLPLDQIDILFIENVGNMVCPTDFRLGAEKRIVVVSSTEGDDVVNKHPMMFRDCTIGVINKVDLAPLVGANLDRMQKDIARYNPTMPVFRTNLKTGDGVAALLEEILK